ncbi:transcriptional regulator ATRX homolog isoform X2 [Chironomus tepperi]|uniref:transcriptional regulator ATRX homolog isoform X2 n=1 Tax=Chironomus tepperi TaxID=113505 RepID=UPI00391F11D3
MVNRRTRAAKKSNEKDSAITKDSDNDGEINESSDNIIQETVSEDSRKKPNNNSKKKKTTETEKLDESEKVSKRTRRRGKDPEENNEESDKLDENNKDSVDNNVDQEGKDNDPEENNKDPEENSKDPEENNDIDDSVQIIEPVNSVQSIEDSENEEAIVTEAAPEETNGDPLNCSDPEVEENSKTVNEFSDEDESSPLNIENYLQIESSLQNDEENSRQVEENNIQDDENASESGENSRQNDSEKQKNDDSNDDTQKDDKPAIGLRLVPLNLLLRQDILNKQDDKKGSSRSTRKSTGRNRKKASYIEISSDEDEQISLSSESSEAEKSSSDDDEESLSSLKRNTRKNNSTKSSKLSNGTKDKIFKEPMSPTKIMKKGKSVSINLEKMPDNVNKLMKCYRVNDDPIEMWSESDDFENMISTTKIDRVALDKEKQDQDVVEVVRPAPRELKRSGKTKKTEETESEVPEKPKKESSKKPQKEKEVKEPTRSRSTRNAAMNRRKIVDDDSESEKSESDESEEDVPLKVIAKSSTTNNKPTRSTRGRNSIATSESEVDKESTSKEQLKNNSEDEKVKDSKSKDDKTKDKKSKDDHSKEKVSKRTQKQETSSDEEKKEKETESRSTRSTRNNKDQQNAAKKSKTESKTPPEKRSSPRKEKSSNLKITISLNQKKVFNHSNDDIEESSKSDSDISSKSDTNPKEVKKNSKIKKISSDTSDSEDEPLTALKNKSVEKDEKKSSDKESDNSDKEKDKSDGDETSPTVDQKLRKRNKFEANKEFNKLKELIEKKKKKQKDSDDEDDTKDRVRKNDKGKENHDKNGESTNKTSEKSKRKRLLSSSEEEEEKEKEENDDDSSSNKKKSKNDLETPAKKRKKNMDDDSDYNNSGGEEDKNSDESQSSDDENGGKRKVKRSSDDEDEDIDELEKGRGKIKRRKRIKKIDSSDEDGDDKGGKASGRKTIRKIMRNDKLDISTKEAAKIERERKQRIEERQKAYNQFYDERPEEVKEITSLVLDFDEETKEPLLEADKKLVKKLKPHQANGIKFMWDACFESVERCRKESGSGCILAHCMGLGKTLQVVTLTHTLLVNSEETDVTRVLVVCPLNTVLNWVNEFHKWLKGIRGYNEIEIYEISKLKQNIDRANKLMEWHNEGGVMIMSYDMFRNLTNDQNNRLRKKIKESLQTSLIDPGPDLVVCDEGHLLKNEKTSISKCMMKLRTSRRIVLTGTPLQNNLKEYYCMVQFVKPNLLGKYQEYMNRFVNPITNGQYTDSTEYDIQVMRRRAHVLHKMLDGCVQRRDYNVLAPFLPPKHEYVLSIKLSPMQVKLYKHYMENKARQGDDTARKGSILFQDFQNLQRIWSAPKALRYNSDRYEVEMQRKRDLESEEESEGSIKDFIDDSESAVSTSSSSDGGSDDDAQSINSDEENNKKKKKKKEKEFVAPRRTRAAAAAFPSEFEAEEEEIAASSKMENPTEWWTSICPEDELNNIEHSSKLMLLMSILEKCEAIGDKLLVFSQSLYSLDVIEHFLNYIDDQTQHNIENASFKASWTLGQDYFRLDGSTPVEQRNSACKHFNSPDNPRARLFLISTRAGGLGINLVAANRVVIFDVSWNPSHDIQSIFRVYRFGQTKPCYIYRFIALGTMEEKIYERQVTKQAISKRVIDEQQIDRHYNQNDLQELYKYELEPDDEVREIPILPKDRLFAEILQKYEDTIWKYHEHDTLLENKEEETLDEDERKQAWEEFEQEKTRPQLQQYYPQPQMRNTGPVTSNNIFGIRTDILLKLLSMKARLDNPTITETNVKHAIPLLMQELYRQMDRGELTLYQQLLALSSSLEVPQNYGGKFQVNEALMHQTYNSINSMPSTSSHATNLYRSQLLARQQNLSAQLQRQKQMRRMSDTVIEID